MRRTWALLVAVAVLLVTGTGAEATVIIAGTSFADNAFADEILDAVFPNPGYVGTATTLEEAFLGSNIDTAADTASDWFVELGFIDNVIVNGPGDDLAIFELGSRRDDFRVSLNQAGTSILVQTVYTGFPSPVYGTINRGTLDLTDLGVAPGATVSSIVIARGTTGIATLAVVGALHADVIPEPATLSLLALGGLALLRRRKR